jgi:hypothetical protein
VETKAERLTVPVLARRVLAGERILSIGPLLGAEVLDWLSSLADIALAIGAFSVLRSVEPTGRLGDCIH